MTQAPQDPLQPEDGTQPNSSPAEAAAPETQTQAETGSEPSGDPTPDPYAQPTPNPYAETVQPEPYGEPTPNPYAEPVQPEPYGEPAPSPYAQPVQPQPYGDPAPGPYAQPNQPPYATPGSQPYGAPYAGAPVGQPVVAPYQGQGMYIAPVRAGSKSKVAAGILGVFLGSLGIHNFYLGNTTKGVIQLLITVLSLGFLSWVSAIWGLVEGIMILVSKPGDQWHRDAAGYELTD